MLIFIGVGVLELLDYKNPQVSQFRIYDNRSEGEEINLGKGNAFLMFGILNPLTVTFVEPDPRIASIKMQVIHVDWSKSAEITVLKELEKESIVKESHPIYFLDDDPLNNFDTRGLYAIKDMSEVGLVN